MSNEPTNSEIASSEPGSVERRLVVVTGLSGAGKSTVVHALEDLGYFCVDNLPSPVVSTMLQTCDRARLRRIALGIDVRVGTFLNDAVPVVDQLAESRGHELTVLFLDAADQALLRRFSSTRRPHPLSTMGAPGSEREAPALLDGIRIERDRLAPLRARATMVVDTTRLSVHDLRRRIVSHFGREAGGMPKMRTRLVSFGFKYGAPVDADLVFDVRFLDNPHFHEQLRPLPGTSEPVKDFVLQQLDTRAFLQHVESLLEFCVPRFEREGKSYLSVAIGCTGGRHRSVVIAQYLAGRIQALIGAAVDVVHRDLERVNLDGAQDPADPSGWLSREVGGAEG